MDDSRIIERANQVFALRLEAVCIHLMNAMRQNVSVPGRKRSIVRTRAGGYRVKWGKLGSEPSRPGEFPRKQTGFFRSSIAYQITTDANGVAQGRVGTAYKVGKFLDRGTMRAAARPWLGRTVREEKAPIDQIMTHGQTFDIKVG